MSSTSRHQPSAISHQPPAVPKLNADSRTLTAESRQLIACRNAFTLIEIMVVIVIIMILVGIVVGTGKHIQTKGARARAQAEIAAMETALESFKNDNGIYPPSTSTRATIPSGIPGAIEINNSIDLFGALAGPPKRYMTFKPEQTRVDKVTGRTYLVDPFGSPYNYFCPPPASGLVWSNQTAFDLWSYGPNSKNDEGTNDDIVNWRQ